MAKLTFDQLDSQPLKPENNMLQAFMAAWRKFYAYFSAANTSRTTATKVLAVQVVDAAGNVLSSTPVLGAGSAVSATDNGPAWTTARGVAGVPFTSADQHSVVASVTSAPTSGQKLVIDDLLISVDTAMNVTFKEETSGTVIHGPIYLPANGTVQITFRGKTKLPTADKKLQVLTSVAGNIMVEATYHSEA